MNKTTKTGREKPNWIKLWSGCIQTKIPSEKRKEKLRIQNGSIATAGFYIIESSPHTFGVISLKYYWLNHSQK